MHELQAPDALRARRSDSDRAARRRSASGPPGRSGALPPASGLLQQAAPSKEGPGLGAPAVFPDRRGSTASTGRHGSASR
jgi:hypothetical protein